MKLNQELFAIKLYEMEQQYAKIQSRIQICGQEDQQKVRMELQKAVDEYREHAEILRKNVEESRSRAVTELARTQLEYSQAMEKLFDGSLEQYFQSEDGSRLENQVEATTLYAEYAMDYAMQTMRHALIAALTAMDLQLTAEEQKGDA